MMPGQQVGDRGEQGYREVLFFQQRGPQGFQALGLVMLYGFVGHAQGVGNFVQRAVLDQGHKDHLPAFTGQPLYFPVNGLQGFCPDEIPFYIGLRTVLEVGYCDVGGLVPLLHAEMVYGGIIGRYIEEGPGFKPVLKVARMVQQLDKTFGGNILRCGTIVDDLFRKIAQRDDIVVVKPGKRKLAAIQEQQYWFVLNI